MSGVHTDHNILDLPPKSDGMSCSRGTLFLLVGFGIVLQDLLTKGKILAKPYMENAFKINFTIDEVSNEYISNFLCILQIPCGRMCDRFGGTTALGYGLLIASIIQLIAPFFISSLGQIGYHTFHILVQLALSPTFPALTAIMSQWIPPKERGIFSATYFGTAIGSALLVSSEAHLEKHYGWKSMYFIPAVTGIVWYFVWHSLIYRSPIQHKRISKREKDYIVYHTRQVGVTYESNPCPWYNLITNGSFVMCVFAHTVSFLGYYSTLDDIYPDYYPAISINYEADRWYMAISLVFTYVIALLSGIITYFIMNINRQVETIKIYKTFTTLGLLCPAILKTFQIYLLKDKKVFLISRSLETATYGFLGSGYLLVFNELAPNFSGTMMGVANCIGHIIGAISAYSTLHVLIEDAILPVAGLQRSYVLTVSCFFAWWIMYIIFAKCKLQKWNFPEISKTDYISRKF